jgi:hypothetical protein
MPLARYFIGASIVAGLAIVFGHKLFEEKPILAVLSSAAYGLLVVYGGLLKYRQSN